MDGPDAAVDQPVSRGRRAAIIWIAGLGAGVIVGALLVWLLLVVGDGRG